MRHYVIFLISAEKKEEVVEALNAGADDYLFKPYDNRELLERIRIGCRFVDLQTSIAGSVRELQETKTALSHLTCTDELTRLANRQSFKDRLAREISAARRYAYPFTLLMAGVDHFKNLNDSFGQEAGDRVLKTFARVMTETARVEDFPARWGDDKFVVLLPHTLAVGGGILAERLRTRFAQAPCEGMHQPLSASFGVVDFMEEDADDSLIGRAESALAQARQKGCNQIVTLSQTIAPTANGRWQEPTGTKNTVVLIIDDDPVITQMLVGILRQVGFQMACAADGKQGIALAKTLRPDLILLDVHLPDMDGFNVCRQIRENPHTADIIVVFISASEDSSIKVKGFEAGCVDFITKPLAGAEVIARVRTHLRLRHAYSSLAQLQGERIGRLVATQQTILPTPEDIPEARFAVSINQIHGAGGDFYDVIPLGDFIVDYVVADAAGHDLETSLWTAAMKVLLREYASPLFAPPDVLQAINRALCRVLPAGLFFTAVYARLNRQTGQLTFVNGGHPPPICLHKNRAPTLIHQTGDVIGAFPDAVFDAIQVTMEQGERFFLYTDGLVEVKGLQEYGAENLAGICQTLCGLPLNAMVKAVMGNMLKRAVVNDDIVLMGVEV